MSNQQQVPELNEQHPRIAVIGVGGAGGNAVNNMIAANLQGVSFIAANTDAQALSHSKADIKLQLGVAMTEGLGAGSKPEIGAAAAEESIEEIKSHLRGLHMAFITAGMGGGTGTGAAPVIAKAAREEGVLAIGVVTKPFQFEGQRRMRQAEFGIQLLEEQVDTLITIPNQNLFKVAVVKTTFSEAFAMADQVLHDGIACITDVMVKEGIINLDFADVNLVMRRGGRAMMGTGEAAGENRGREAAELAVSNPLLEDVTLQGARGLLVSIIGGPDDLTLYEVDEAANRVREEVDPDANIIVGTAFDDSLSGKVRVSVVATGLEDRDMTVAPLSEAASVAAVQKIADEPAPQQQGFSQTPAPEPARAEPQQQARQRADCEPSAGLPPHAHGAAPAPQPKVEATMPPSEPYRPVDEVYGQQYEQMSARQSEPLRAEPNMRMPGIEDFPPVGQKVLRAQEEEPKARRGLFERLANLASGHEQAQSYPHNPQNVAVEPHLSKQSHPVDNQGMTDPIDPHVKGGALSAGDHRVPSVARESMEDTDFPLFLRKNGS